MSTVYKLSGPIDTIIARKLRVNETAMLHGQSEVDNEPTEDNHTATKKYVDQVVSQANYNGSDTILVNVNNIEVNSSGISNQVLLSSGTPGTASTFGALPLGNENSVTGTLNVARGGTGASTFTSNAILKGNGTGPILSSGVIIDSNDNIINPNGTFCGKFSQVPSSNAGIQVPSYALFLLITEGTATANFNIDQPAYLFNGQILFIYNASSYNALSQYLAVESNKGGIFASDGSDWYRITP